MKGSDAAKLASEGWWVRRKSWSKSWPDQFVTDVVWLRRDIGDDYLEEESGLVRFQIDSWGETADEPILVWADYIPLDEKEWEADDWEAFDKETVYGWE
jgi:hypothetical protein